ncbi:hypothetical protein EW026_g1895 [Hermanssonia centrifuga]|uniref:Uncharacterized protein n=1 Tax=Hermanssonia centrifuga TaxID=98765 RepID=A0A4S4KUJ2_9APHY|nr:hypothetical protein EW026_g1895 [Hermanssonia centrifuga]
MSTVWNVEFPASDDGENRLTAFRQIINAILDGRQRSQNRDASEPTADGFDPTASQITDEDFSHVLAELVRDGTVVLHEDEEAEDEEDHEEDEEEEEELDEDDDDMFGYYNDPISNGRWYEEVKQPKQEGMSLLFSGEFGRIRHQIRSRNEKSNVASILLNRGTKIRPTYKEDLLSDLVPNSDGTAVANYYANAYVGQYSSDSSFYYTCVRDFRLHVYDTTAPVTPTVPSHRTHRTRGGTMDHDHDTSMKVIKTIRAHPGGWTITDSHLSPDNQRMIYASVSNIVYMASTLDSNPTQVPINFADPVRRGGGYGYEDHYGVWSCKFSADGNEVIAGGTEMVFVYDLLADKRTVKIKAHEDDINSCCWADTASGNVLVSASDDTFLKVWDRRSLGSSPKPSGVLIGHTEGITYVSAKGDGRYVISNGKDQVLRMWDIRKMRSSLDFEQVKDRHYGIPNYDYSVMQYTGHEVLRTLIRCHFSPAETTGGQYIYSGGADGRIHIWSLDGRVVQVLDRSGTLPMSYDPSGPQPAQVKFPHRKVCVRDVSWHSQQPILMSAGWLGSGWGANESSVIARHEWKGLSKMQYSLQDYVERQTSERAERAQRRGVLRSMPGSYQVDTDGDD